MAISKDSDRVQKQGLCELAYDIVGERKGDNKDTQLLRKIFKLRAALPIKTSATHFVTDNPLIHVLVKLTAPFSDLHTKSRTRVHFGTLLCICVFLWCFLFALVWKFRLKKDM